MDPLDLERPGPRLTLVLGGARSGKSVLAERLTLAHGPSPLYVATALRTPDDAEMEARIAAHCARRGPTWTTIEAGLDLTRALRAHGADPTRPILVDCLILWLGGLMMASPTAPAPDFEDFLTALSEIRSPTVIVSGEVGLGLVPMDPLSRAYRDALGLLNQRVASLSDRVLFCIAGLPLPLKGVQGPSGPWWGGFGRGEAPPAPKEFQQ